MSRKKLKLDNHLIELNKEQFEKLQAHSSNELFSARNNFANKYNEYLLSTNDAKLSLKKARKESPIVLPYEYSIENNSIENVIISVKTKKDLDSIKSILGLEELKENKKEIEEEVSNEDNK